MSAYLGKEPSTELWAVLYKIDGSVAWTRGGSSSSPKLMVYPTSAMAQKALQNSWTRQVIDPDDVIVSRIYVMAKP